MVQVAENAKAEPLRVYHSALKRSTSSAYLSDCPKCDEGVLPCCRDSGTFKLINVDRCTLCAQVFIYEDDTIAGQEVVRLKKTLKPEPAPAEQTFWTAVRDDET
jgi:hypothetical protein